eukprot:6629327-Prorocentrum_lima.AAC.1
MCIRDSTRDRPTSLRPKPSMCHSNDTTQHNDATPSHLTNAHPEHDPKRHTPTHAGITHIHNHGRRGGQR